MKYWRVIWLLVLTSSAIADSKNQVFSDFSTPLPLKEGDILVMGIVGGWERWDAEHRGTRRTALQLRGENLPGVWIETVENHKLYLADELVRNAFDFDKSGKLEPGETKLVRLILYGHSLGGRATLRFCRELNAAGIPVQMAILIDAYGRDPYTVPPNVSLAANLYQRDTGFVRGSDKLVAEDPQRTRILGNWRYTYRDKDVPMPDHEPRMRRWFMGSHLKMEYDPAPWQRVKELIIEAAKNGTAVATGSNN
jgi:pimeloyl-ACP methyl ester carboxylesterase